MPEQDSLPPEVDTYYNKGLLAFEKKNYDYAIELFVQALKLKRNFVDARHYLRLSEQRKFQENPPDALSKILNKIINLPALLKAIILDSKNQTAAAIEEYEKILRNEPNNIYVLTRLAEGLLKEADVASALMVFEQTRRINPNNVVVLKNLGRLYAQTENYTSARQCYEAVLKIVPHEPEAEKGIKNLDALGTIKDSFGQAE